MIVAQIKYTYTITFLGLLVILYTFYKNLIRKRTFFYDFSCCTVYDE